MKQIIKLLFLTLISTVSLFGAPANTPTITVSPVVQEAVVGTEYAYLHVFIDECPTSKEIVVTATDSNNSTYYDEATFLSPSCIQVKVISIDISGVALYDSLFVDLVATSDQSVNTITTTPVEIKIVPPPTNTPIVSISPVTKNILNDTPPVSVDMNVLISECPNKEDINATIAYIDEANLTYTQTFNFDVNSCNLSEPFVVNVPFWLDINESMEVNLTAVTFGDQIIGSISPNVATITVLETISDLNITKTAPGIVVVDDQFEYSLTVTNLGASDAFDIEIRDELPFGVELNATVSSEWTCSETDGVVSCSYDGNISSGGASTITLQVTAPSYAGIITNTATVVSGNDGDILNNVDSASTEIVDLGRATDLCYVNSTFTESATNTCSDRVGISYYKEAGTGHTCTATMNILNATLDKTLTEVKVTKLYNPGINVGTSNGNFVSSSDLINGYASGYEYEFDDFGPDGNETIEDTDTTESIGEITDIVLYGEYEKDDFSYAGIISACTGGAGSIDFASNDKADVIDTFTSMADYNFDVINNAEVNNHITTKVAGESPVTITGVHLDRDTNMAAPYAPAAGDASWRYSIIPYLSDGTCSTTGTNIIDPTYDQQLVIDIPFQTVAATAQMTVPSLASKENRIKIIIVDLATLSVEGQQCILTSSTTGNFARIAQCANSAVQYVDAFGDNAWERCGLSSGAPCLSDNHGVADVNDPSYDPIEDSIYVNDLGCYMCTFDLVSNCSTDDFAIRPDRFETNSTDISYPDLLRAGNDYNLTLVAYDFNDQNTTDYDQSISNIESNVTQYDANGNVASMAGTTTGNLTGGGSFTHGITISPAQFTYDEVGDIAINLVDTNWAAVDFDDTDQDCDPDGAYVCGDINVTFIPDHFRVQVDLNNSSNGFTYLSSDGNMTAYLRVQIWAENAADVTTENFTFNPANRYEHNVTIKLTVPDPLSLGTEEHEFNSEELVGFDEGYKDFISTETNATLWFNYNRSTKDAVNPFRISGSEVKVDVNATYVSTNGATEGMPPLAVGTAYIDGTDADDTNLTYVYGRAHMARTRAMCGIGSDCNAYPIFYYEFYGNKEANQTLITQLLDPLTPQRSIDSVNWYKNTKHAPASDGNVTASNAIIDVTASYATDTPPNDSRTKGTFVYDTDSGYPYKVTVEVNEDTNQTQSWLIYDKYKADATQVTGQLEFYGPGKWSSTTSGADTSVDDNASSGNIRKNTNRRIRW